VTAGAWWLFALAAFWGTGSCLEACSPSVDWSHRPAWPEWAMVAFATLITLTPAWPVSWAWLAVWALPTSWQRLRAVVPHGGTVYLTRRRAGCWPPTRAGWVQYVGSTDDWARRVGEHQDDRRDDWGEWKRDADWPNSGPAWHTFTRTGAGRLENRLIKLLTYGARINALPPIENVAATRVRRGPHPVMWLRLKRWKWLDGTAIPARRFYLTPTPRPDSDLSDSVGPFPDAIDVDSTEAGETSPGRTDPSDPLAHAAAVEPDGDTGPPEGAPADDGPDHDSSTGPVSHPSAVPAVPSHPAIPSHPSVTPVGGPPVSHGTWDTTVPLDAWDGETEPDDLDATGMASDGGPEVGAVSRRAMPQRRRKRTGGRSNPTRRSEPSGPPGWVGIARTVVAQGGTVTEAWEAVKAAGWDASRSTVGRWTKDG
jgi:hypothetical protein